MASGLEDVERRLRRLERRVAREVDAREAAEALLEQKSAELYERNLELRQFNATLEERVRERTLELEAQRAKAERLARTDHLTQLGNRLALSATLDRFFETEPFAYLVIDLDRFKKINDDFGHDAGDHVLERVAERLRRESEPFGSVFRLGGDEFALVLPAGDRDAVSRFAKKIHEAVARPIDFFGAALCVGCSIGVALHPSDAGALAALQGVADFAAYEAKSRGGGVAVATDKIKRESKARAQLARDLARAIANREIDVWFQPLVDVTDRSIRGAEALARWFCRDRGPVPPDRFIAIAERNGLILDLGALIFEKVCRAVGPWVRSGRIDHVGINISPVQMSNPETVEILLSSLEAHDIPTSAIYFEITEEILMRDLEQSKRTMIELNLAGIRFSLDDFGVGYSNLRYLQELPVEQLKIDRSFVDRIDKDRASLQIVQAMIDLSHHLELEVVAEGIETKDQFECIERLGCDIAQGFWLYEPLAAERFASLLRSDAKGAADLARA